MGATQNSSNPLRPYYRPPSVGLSQDSRGTANSGTHGYASKNNSASSYASSARDIFSDIDYTDYLSESSPSLLDSAKKQIDEWLYRYTTILLAQPFDVAKTVLQVKIQNSDGGETFRVEDSRSRQVGYVEPYQSDDSDPDEPAYFTSNSPYSQTERRRHERSTSLSPPPKSKPLPAHQLVLKSSDSILEVVCQEWVKEGVWGVWKGSNTTFLYGFLLETLEKWTQSLLSAILNVPELRLSSGLDVAAEFPFTWTSLAVSIAAAVISGVILAPLDLIRTKLIMTPTSLKKRSLMSQQRLIHSYFCHPTLLLPTILHSLITPTITHSTTLILRSYISIDPVISPSTYQLGQLLSRLLELYLKLPFETVLRRAQINTLKTAFQKSKEPGISQGHLLTTIPIGEYRGVIGTMWYIVTEEGTRNVHLNQDIKRNYKPKKGQGFSGLWRGWRVGMWGLVGSWGLRVFNGSSGSIGEF